MSENHRWQFSSGLTEIREDVFHYFGFQIDPSHSTCSFQVSTVSFIMYLSLALWPHRGSINGITTSELAPQTPKSFGDNNNTNFEIIWDFRIPYKGHTQPLHYVIRGPSSSKGLESRLRCILGHNSQEEDLGTVRYASNSQTEKQLSSLDSYFGKLQNSTTVSPDNSNKKREAISRKNDNLGLKEELEYLDAYLGKLNKDTNPIEKPIDLAAEDSTVPKPLSIIQDSVKGDGRKLIKSYISPKSTSDDQGQESEISDLYLISILGSINIAVFLFEMASPVRNSELELFSLPLLYGAKINDLILVGEWWRLVTPMFLYSGLIHIAIGSWGLVTFGPKVYRGYGSFTFFLIYILGGISGNLISFLHTPEPTVGGTGPIFAMIGAWLIYQIQNKDIIAKEVSDSMFQKAIITTAFTFTLSSFGPIDDWTHFGAALTGIAYGFLTCPSLQLDDASSSSSTSGQEEGITLVRRYANPCKSLFLFTAFVLVLSSLLFVVEPPLNALASDNSV